MTPHSTYDACLGVAGASFIAVIGALSVSTYDWAIVTGIAILSFDIPVLLSFARWIPDDLHSGSTWHDHFAIHTFVFCIPIAAIGISFILVHVHIVCGVLFALSSITSFVVYKRRVDAAFRAEDKRTKMI